MKVIDQVGDLGLDGRIILKMGLRDRERRYGVN
jgi:hypothetical protein